MKKSIALAIAAMIWLLPGTALADGAAGTSDPHSGHGTAGHETAATPPPGSKSEEQATPNEGLGGHSHGSTAEVVETPANLPVLGSFAAVNGTFLLAGIWVKIRKVKGGRAA
jgi:hypothetical protein